MSFESLFSTSRISRNPSGVHETMISKTSQVLRSALPNDPKERFNIRHNQIVVGFLGNYASSSSTPDLMLQCTSVRDGKLQNQSLLVLELGFSQSYSDLERSMKLWIEGTETVSIAMLIKIDEDPRYRNPLLEAGWEAHASRLPKLASIRQEDVPIDPNDRSSPLHMYGLPFAGRFSAFFELWRRNKDGRAELEGERVVS
jgi:hypothetical protein